MAADALEEPQRRLGLLMEAAKYTSFHHHLQLFRACWCAWRATLGGAPAGVANGHRLVHRALRLAILLQGVGEDVLAVALPRVHQAGHLRVCVWAVCVGGVCVGGVGGGWGAE